MKKLTIFTVIILFFLQLECRTIYELGNGRIFPYSGTIKNWACITRKENKENPRIDQFEKLFCIIDFPISFAFDTVFLLFTIPSYMKSEDRNK